MKLKDKYTKWDEAFADGLRTRTQWNKKGRALLKDAKPISEFLGNYDNYHLYPESATRLKIRFNVYPAKKIDLLASIFVVTRAAKRYRDAASKCYELKAYGPATTNRHKKEICYELKDRGIVSAFRSGLIHPVSTSSNLTVYRGDGYCFHSLLRPVEWVQPENQNTEDNPIFVEAKPKDPKEPRLKDAIATLEALPKCIGIPDGFNYIPFPSSGQ